MSPPHGAEPATTPACVSSGAPSLSRECFEGLYRDSWPVVVDYLRFRIGPSDADDVAADIFVRAWEAREQYDSARGSPQAWLWGIARNAASDRLRRPNPERHVLPDQLSIDTDLAERGEKAVRMARVAKALSELDPFDRDIVALRFGGGLTHREVAELVGLTEAAAATRLHRAIKRLRAGVERRGEL